MINRDTGVWYNFSAGMGGDIFKYVSQSQNISYKEAIEQIGNEIKAPQLIHINWAEKDKRQHEFKLQAEIEEKVKIERSQQTIKRLYDTSLPLKGTIAERYLREHRKIKTAELPHDLRFISEFKDYDSDKTYPALAAFARDAEGKVTSAQVTCLDPLTANKADIEVKKRSLGAIKGTTVEIQKGEGATFVAEGIETALSLKEVQMKGRILVSLGLSNMSNIGAHLNKEDFIVLCADADDPNSSAWKTSERALEKLQREGFKVSIIRPQGEKGRDFNDVLQEEGVKAVQEQLESFESYNSQTFRSVENETSSTGTRESTKTIQVNSQEISHFSSTQEKLNAAFDLRQKFEVKNPELAAKLREEMKALSEVNRLKIAEQKELRAKHLSSLKKLEKLIRQHKFARNDQEKTRAESELKKYALELYKQDPQLTSISIRNKEAAELVRNIIKENQRQHNINKTIER